MMLIQLKYIFENSGKVNECKVTQKKKQMYSTCKQDGGKDNIRKKISKRKQETGKIHQTVRS